MRFLVLVLMVLPLPAFALSCLPHTVTDAFLEAKAADESFVPVLGTLTFDAGLLPKVDWQNQQDTPGTTLIPATFRGDALGVRGVPWALEADVVLEVQCLGPWCPSPQPGRSLAFLRKTAHSYVLHTNACGGFLFGDPSDVQINAVRDCLAGRDCAPSPLR
jgi:hypothetical protein